VGKKVQAMDWEFILALIVAVPIILLPVAFVWYLNIGGVLAAVREARRKRARRREETKAAETSQE
jgi:hypothetical protein